MFSSSKSATTNANASDGGFLNWQGISPFTINEGGGNGVSTKTLILIALGVVGALVGLWLLLRK